MFFDKFKKLEEKNNDKGEKRKIENIVVFIIILIIVVLVINKVWLDDGTDGEIKENEFTKLANNEKTDATSNDLEERLENILETIEGVEKVSVLLNYSESSTLVALYNENETTNTTQEQDTEGGTRNVTTAETQKEVAYSGDEPITEKIIMPKIEGAIITAKGVSNAQVKSNVIAAVEAITGLMTHKIQVFERGN